MKETTQCGNCGANMILVMSGTADLTNPPQYHRTWWCECGFTKEAPSYIPKSYNEIRRERWEKANKKD